MKVLIVFGTRPEAIKMAPLVKKMKIEPDFEVKVCVTAQHREMLDQVLDFFDIIPDYDLDLMKPNQTLNQLSGNIITKIDEVLLDYNPSIVLVHGDTTTSSMVALASFHRQIKVGHVEAGLRTYKKYSPFPEEINRQITGRLANYHFAPTDKSANNLKINEQVLEEDVIVTGNTVIDALLWGIKNVNENRKDILNLKKIIKADKKVILVTGHRRENFGDKFLSFCNALIKISERNDVQIIYPVHLNPNVKEVVHKKLENIPNIYLTKPLDYEVFIWMMTQSYFIISDSGGIQEEAPSLGKPVLVTREVTERQEVVESGAVKLVGANEDIIYKEAMKLLDSISDYEKMSSVRNPYGEGNASQKIINYLKKVK